MEYVLEYPSNPALPFNPKNKIVIDGEFTGLNIRNGDRILEIAVAVTTPDFKERVQGPAIVIHQAQEVLDGMDMWNRMNHRKTGLTKRSQASAYDESKAESEILTFLKRYVPAGHSPFCGKVVAEDKRYVKRFMPQLYDYFSPQDLDVQGLISKAHDINPAIVHGFKRSEAHTAQADVNEIIDMFLYYRQFVK